MVELLLQRPAGDRIADLVLAPGTVLHAPHLLDAEVAQVFRRLEGPGALGPERAGEALDDLRALRLVRHGHPALLGRAWELRRKLSAYDALYVALAEALEAPLVTLDRRVASASGHGAAVVVP